MVLALCYTLFHDLLNCAKFHQKQLLNTHYGKMCTISIFCDLQGFKYCKISQINKGDLSYCFSKHIDGGYLTELHQ